VLKSWFSHTVLVVAAGVIGFALSGTAHATPTTHIWGPSTDVQAFKVVHLTSDLYAASHTDAAGNRVPPTINLGLTVGILPFQKLNMEIGFDVIQNGTDAVDDNPMFYNAKLGIPENAFTNLFPAVAVGSYLLGGKKDLTDANVLYGKIAKTFGPIGRFSVGYYWGNDKVLVDEGGGDANEGVMLVWEKTVTELSDKLWVCVEYMSGNSFLGTTNFGFAWAFTPNVSWLFGYDIMNNQDLDQIGVVNTFTSQLDVNF
jgi:hypothetical protein